MQQQPAAPGGDLNKLNDPNFLVELAIGPPVAPLVPQQPGTGVVFGGLNHPQPHRYLFKKAHMSTEDFRVFDAQTGQVVCVSSHVGKNPYEAMDPLGLSNAASYNGPWGEWDSICRVFGYNGMPSFKIRPKTLSRHGRQYIQDPQGQRTFCNVAKQSRFSTMSIRHNLEVCKGDSDDTEWEVLVDLAGRTMQIMNSRNERVAHLEKSLKTLIMNASFGVGSEIIIDVAPGVIFAALLDGLYLWGAGVDWTAVLATVMGIQQVGKHFVKDAFGNFVGNPLQNYAQDTVLGATGLQGVASTVGGYMDQGVHQANWFNQLQNLYFH